MVHAKTSITASLWMSCQERAQICLCDFHFTNSEIKCQTKIQTSKFREIIMGRNVSVFIPLPLGDVGTVCCSCLPGFTSVNVTGAECAVITSSRRDTVTRLVSGIRRNLPPLSSERINYLASFLLQLEGWQQVWMKSFTLKQLRTQSGSKGHLLVLASRQPACHWHQPVVCSWICNSVWLLTSELLKIPPKLPALVLFRQTSKVKMYLSP